MLCLVGSADQGFPSDTSSIAFSYLIGWHQDNKVWASYGVTCCLQASLLAAASPQA
jgi:hypothetical protein